MITVAIAATITAYLSIIVFKTYLYYLLPEFLPLLFRHFSFYPTVFPEFVLF